MRPLLPGSPSVMVLVTSRDSPARAWWRATAPAAWTWTCCRPADAVALLRTLIGDRVDADPEAAPALASLCARLPLALRVAAELAAARPGMPLAELAAELADERNRLELLDAGGDPRSAVASVLSWSYRHLPRRCRQDVPAAWPAPGPGLGRSRGRRARRHDAEPGRASSSACWPGRT